MMARKLTIQDFGLRAPCRSSLLRGLEVSAPDERAASMDARLVLSVMRTKSDAEKPAPVVDVRPPVAHVLAPRGLSQIAEAIIRRIAILMINVLGRPLARHVKPCQPVSEIEAMPFDADLNISVRHGVARHFFGATAVPILRPLRVVPPSENSRLRIVIEKATNLVSRQISLFNARHVSSSVVPTPVDLTRSRVEINLVGA